MHAIDIAVTVAWLACLGAWMLLDRAATKAGHPNPAHATRVVRTRDLLWIVLWWISASVFAVWTLDALASGEIAFRKYGYLGGLSLNQSQQPAAFWSAIVAMVSLGAGSFVVAVLETRKRARRQRDSQRPRSS